MSKYKFLSLCFALSVFQYILGVIKSHRGILKLNLPITDDKLESLEG